MTNGRDTSIFITFLDSLPRNYTILKSATFLEVELGSAKYHHQGGGLPYTVIASILLDHFSMVDERDPFF
jgi:hypothetical protein